MGRSPHDTIFSGPQQLERVMAKLLAGSKWQNVRWHRWHRLCAATLYQAGTPMPSIKSWWRWRSTQTARGYTECPEEGTPRATSQEPQIPSARTCMPRSLQDWKSAIYGRQDCSPATFSATTKIVIMAGGAAQATRGAVTPRFDPGNVYRRESVVEGPEPNVVGRSPHG